MQHVISIDLGGTNIRVGIVRDDLEIIKVNRERTSKDGKEAIFTQICRLIDSLPYKDYNITKVGVSACGVIDHNLIKNLPNLGVTEDFDLKGMLEEKYPFTVEIKNDANCTALAEATFGSTKDVRDSYFITISTGIGGCLIYDHTMIDLPFENGHEFISHNGKVEEFEKLCSGNGIVSLCKEYGLEIPHAGEMFALKDTNEIANRVYNEWTDMVSIFLANTQMQFNLDKIVLSGGVMKSSSFFFETLENKANRLIAHYPLKPIKLVLAQFDQDAGLMGGVSVALAIK